jgi:hypothetical protein
MAPVSLLHRDPLSPLCVGRSRQDQQRALREYTEQPVRQEFGVGHNY